MNTLYLPKLSFYVTLRCNLRCKLCGTYAPYYDRPYHPTLEFICRSTERVFEVVQSIGLFSITGGEPLLREDLYEFVNFVSKYQDRIAHYEIITNGTCIPNELLIKSLQPLGEKVQVLVDDYGSDKSVNAAVAVEKFSNGLPAAKVTYRSYSAEFGNEIHCNGWVDYNLSNTPKHNDAQAKTLFAKCAIPNALNLCMSIVDGVLYSCTQTRRLVDLGIIHPPRNEVFNLFSTLENDDILRQRIEQVFNCDMLTACAYCDGLCPDSIRFAPAEQIQGEKAVPSDIRLC